ncbi:MAG TPA: hypothetical protein ENN78_01490, partial [Candidatus Omnitrophica bacterium]|nr:hypothetical protein [Candidatus Omnitrophota bacterium]
MSAFLIHSKDYSLPEIFLESQIKIAKPDKVSRFSFKDADFQELAGKIFNFSLFDGRTIYFLDNAEKLTKKEVAFIKERIDFNRLSGTYIFNLISKTYWLKTPYWENIKGLKIKELKFTAQDIVKYIKDYTGKELPKDTVEYIAGLY